MKKFINICEYILFILFIVLLPFMVEKVSILLGIPIVLILFFINKKLNFKHFPIFIFIISLIVRIITVIYLKVDIVDDFKVMLSASRDLINGNIEFINGFYFKSFSYQLGHVLYQALFLKMINSVLFLKIINSIITSLIVVFIYLISKNIVKEETARLVSLLYLFLLYPLYLNTILTNQHLPALLSLIAIYLLFVKKDNWKLYIIVGIILGLANFLRTESIMFIAGIVFYLVLTNKKTKETFIKCIVLITTYLFITTTMSTLIYISPLHTKLNSRYPEWKFYCGLSDSHNGIYNEEDQDIFFNTENKKELLINRVKEENIKLPILFLKKEVILWTQTNYDLRINNHISNIVLLFNQGYLNLIIILFVISLLPRKEKNNKYLLLKIIISLYYGIYMLIEISPRYAYILHILVFILIGIGIERICDKIKMRWKNAKV